MWSWHCSTMIQTRLSVPWNTLVALKLAWFWGIGTAYDTNPMKLCGSQGKRSHPPPPSPYSSANLLPKNREWKSEVDVFLSRWNLFNFWWKQRVYREFPCLVFTSVSSLKKHTDQLKRQFPSVAATAMCQGEAIRSKCTLWRGRTCIAYLKTTHSSFLLLCVLVYRSLNDVQVLFNTFFLYWFKKKKNSLEYSLDLCNLKEITAKRDMDYSVR